MKPDDYDGWLDLYVKKLRVSLIPLKWGDKRPEVHWKNFQVQPPSPDQIRSWFLDGKLHNFGVLCGPASGNLAVLDFDSVKAYEKFFPNPERRKELEAKTVVVKTGRGVHVWLRTPKPIESFRIPQLSLDVKASGYVVAPPSLHPNGSRYAFLSPNPSQILMVEDLVGAVWRRAERLGVKRPQKPHREAGAKPRKPRLKLSAKEKAKIVNILTKYWRRGSRHHLTIYTVGWLMKKGVREEDVADIIAKICDQTRDEEKRQRLHQVHWHYARGKPTNVLKGISGIAEIFRALKGGVTNG
jgi:hypothetical protein